MDIDQRWIIAVIAVFSGFAIGSILAITTRRIFGSPTRRTTIRTIAPPAATFLFWLSVIAGALTALGSLSPDTLKPIPSEVLAWLPRVLAAGMILLAGYAGGNALAAAVASASQRAVGHRPASFERALRWGILAASIMLALGNIGVQTQLLNILVAGALGSVGLTFALLAAVGGQTVASSIAAGRALRQELAVGAHLKTGELEGYIAAVRPSVIHLDRGTDHTTIVPIASLLEHHFEVTLPAADV